MQIIKACASKLSAEEMLSKESSVKVQEDFMIRTKEKCQQSFLHAFHPTKDGPCVPNFFENESTYKYVGLLKMLGYSPGTHELTWKCQKIQGFWTASRTKSWSSLELLILICFPKYS